MSSTKILRELRQFSSRAESVFGGQVDLMDYDLTWVKVRIRPSGGPYVGGRFLFKIQFSGNAGLHAPQVNLLTPILHPNMDHSLRGTGGNVCLSILNSDQWRPHFGLEEVLQALLYVLHYPNLDDFYSPFFWDGGPVSYELFEAEVRDSLLGRNVRGVQFTKNYFTDEESEKEGAHVEPVSLIGESPYSNDTEDCLLPEDESETMSRCSLDSDDIFCCPSEVSELAKSITMSVVRSVTEELSEPQEYSERVEPRLNDRADGTFEVISSPSRYSEEWRGLQFYPACAFIAPDYDFILFTFTTLCWDFLRKYAFERHYIYRPKGTGNT